MLNSLSNHSIFKKAGLFDVFAADPLKFIDVGARGGVHSAVYPLANITSVLAFDPDAGECKKIKKHVAQTKYWHDFTIMPWALYNCNAPIDIHLISTDTNNSILLPNAEIVSRYKLAQDKWACIGKTSATAYTLDSVLHASDQLPSHGEFIKLDTQGTEFEILEAAPKTLKNNTVGVLTEVSFCELYKNQKLFSEIELMLREYGFKFYGFPSLQNRSTKLFDKNKGAAAERYFQADALFLKDPFEQPGPPSAMDTRQNRVLFLLGLLYHYYDLCLELLAGGVFSNSSVSLDLAKKLVESLATDEKSTLIQQFSDVPKGHPQDVAHVPILNFINANRAFANVNEVLGVSSLPHHLEDEGTDLHQTSLNESEKVSQLSPLPLRRLKRNSA